MADLTFDATLHWAGTGRSGEGQSPESESEESRQVRNRHHFHASPERGKLWLDTMLGTIDDMDFHEVAKNVLKEKISRLMNHLG